VNYTSNKSPIKSICLTVIGIGLFAASCKLEEEKLREMEAWQTTMDSTGNALLDSIYKIEAIWCDSVQKLRLPHIVDSLLKADSSSKAAH